jgi:hypothetical protein
VCFGNHEHRRLSGWFCIVRDARPACCCEKEYPQLLDFWPVNSCVGGMLSPRSQNRDLGTLPRTGSSGQKTWELVDVDHRRGGKVLWTTAESAELRCLRVHRGRPRAYVEGDPSGDGDCRWSFLPTGLLGAISPSTGSIALGYLVPLVCFAGVTLYGLAAPLILPPPGTTNSEAGVIAAEFGRGF